MLASFLAFLRQLQHSNVPHPTTLVAVSGGVDSVVLCHLFKQANLPFAIVHCHFNLRGKEADAAYQLVEKLAKQYQVTFYSQKFETKSFAAQHKISLQMAARMLRYQFFHQLLIQHDLRQIATAHHWDDVVETILFNFIKGTGIKGLYAMQSIQGSLIRPLCFARKQEIIAYAQQEQLTWQEDSSNQQLHYQRNFIRHAIIPSFYRINPNFETTLQETSIRLRDIGQFFHHYLANLRIKVHRIEDAIHYIAIDKIVHLPWATTMSFELIRPYGFTFKQTKQLLQMPSGKQVHAPRYILYVDRNQWIIREKQAVDLPCHAIYKHTESLCYPPYTFYFQTALKQDYNLFKNATIAALDYDTLQFPLTIRPWQAGDFFYPLGMQGHKKKISDFLIDHKVALAIKKQVLVIISHTQIIWVVGYGIDERFKVSPKTKKIMEIKLKK